MKRRTKKGIEVALTIVSSAVAPFLLFLDGKIDLKYFAGAALAQMILTAKSSFSRAPKDVAEATPKP